MSTRMHNLSAYDASKMPPKAQVAQQIYSIVVAEWNKPITGALLNGAINTLMDNGARAKNIHVEHVPGTFELTFAARSMAMRTHADAVIAIGCVVRGDTPHFDYICQSVTIGLTRLNAIGTCPFIFGVLTTNTIEQAQERAGGKLGNKGSEAAVAAIRMANFAQ